MPAQSGIIDFVRLFDPFLFLFGHRGAVERLVTSSWSLLVGAVFVVTAGIARNYDHLDLTSQGEWLVGPFAVSFFSALFIYAICQVMIRPPKGSPRKDFDAFRMPFTQFLSLFWLTAPCAWIYAIPVENWGDLLFATKWNLAFLGIVSFWRVILMIRVLRVLTGAPVAVISLSILFPAAVEACVASFFKGLSLIGIMGGVRLPPHHVYLRDATAIVSGCAFWVAAFSLTALVALFVTRTKGAVRPFPPFQKSSSAPILAGILSLVAWVAIALPIQTGVRNSRILSQLIAAEKFPEAITFAAQIGPEGFSQIHYLPPRPFDHEGRHLPALLAHVDKDTPAWLRSSWAENYALSLTVGSVYRYLDPITREQIEHLKSIPEIGPAIRAHQGEIFSRLSDFPPDAQETIDFRAGIEEIADDLSK